MTSTDPKVTYEEVETARRAFSRKLNAFQKQKGRYHNPAPELPTAKLADCQLLPNRMELLHKIRKGGVMAEIGVDRGDFSLEILKRCAPDKLHLFDIDISRLVNPEILGHLESGSGRVTTHVGDSSANMAKMPDDSFDMIYIDGDHAYEGVMKDVEASLPKLKESGVLIFNDYATWSAVSMFHCGVARAVHETCLNHPFKFRYMALQTMLYNDVMLGRE